MVTSTEFSQIPNTNRWLFLPAEVMVRAIWRTRLRITASTIAFAILGVVVAFVQQPEFQSEARIIPEMNTGASDLFKRLSSMAGFAEVDFSDAEGVDAIRPDLYPTVLQSTPFILFLLKQPITIKGQLKTVGQFLTTGQISWPWKQWRLFDRQDQTHFSGKGPLYLTTQQQELAEEISERVNAKLNTRSGVITITVQMPDAQAAALVAQLAMNYLTQYVRNYRTGKARQDLAFYKQQLTDARKRYQAAQFTMFHYNDNHKAIAMQEATLDRHRMEDELAIARTVYTELSRRFEQAKLNVQERTPIFNVLEPPKVPLKRSSPKRVLTVLLVTGAGFMISILIVWIRQANLAGRFKAMIAEDRVLVAHLI
ncbi:Wzz/FepE/Etk N-terminal domain-containing protein [Spirosoma foliorum]|uniref:Lipopolysaccharide biosynthesis protein n=1 Tax=Spirosoma foliorum TaxID=2710596 RepID=A0A7G5GRF9_9BACT|nr:Wzz/FepE/Etk N-terminal domain-containing protein [Spirosoma foliorum]QMW01451.1 lipopolysaccharide biosynthesis protein [Spirosoma foliorum]